MYIKKKIYKTLTRHLFSRIQRTTITNENKYFEVIGRIKVEVSRTVAFTTFPVKKKKNRKQPHYATLFPKSDNLKFSIKDVCAPTRSRRHFSSPILGGGATRTQHPTRYSKQIVNSVGPPVKPRYKRLFTRENVDKKTRVYTALDVSIFEKWLSYKGRETVCVCVITLL